MHDTIANGKISIKDIAIDCIIGVTPYERSKKQAILVSLLLELDMDKASQTDALEDTQNYRNIYEDVIMLVEQSEFHLLEALAGNIITRCLEYHGVLSVTVQVTKPNIFEKAKGVTVEITKRLYE